MIERIFGPRGICYRTNDFDADRVTLVFIHGVSGSSSAWQAYETRFMDRYNIVTYDLRGHGKSTKFARYRDYAIPHFAEDLAALLAHLGRRKVVLVAHSFASLIVLEYLRRHQADVLAVVLLSADYDIGRRASARLLGLALSPLALLDRLPFRPPPGSHVDYSRFVNSTDWDVPRMRADIGNTTWRVYLHCTRQGMAVHARDWLPDIQVPVLLIHGRKDTIFPVQNSIDMADWIPDAELVILEDIDHIVVLNRPREIGDAIEGFLERRASIDRLKGPFMGTAVVGA
jgi:pimeloyl-ACP methyl ester carboxylesterase